MRIKKIEPAVGLMGKVRNTANNSTTDTYSCDYINDIVEDIKEIDAISAQMSSDFTMTNAATAYRLPINTVIESVGTKLTVTNASNGVVIGSGVHYILVSGSIYWYSGVSNTECVAYIYKNDTSVVVHNKYCADNYEHTALPMTLIPVSEGDVINIRVYQQQTGGGLIKNYPTSTFLTVVVLK